MYIAEKRNTFFPPPCYSVSLQWFVLCSFAQCSASLTWTVTAFKGSVTRRKKKLMAFIGLPHVMEGVTPTLGHPSQRCRLGGNVTSMIHKVMSKTGGAMCKYGDCTPSSSRQPSARELSGQRGDCSEKMKAFHFTDIYSAFEGLGSSMFADILATKAQLSPWVSFRSTKEWMKSHNRTMETVESLTPAQQREQQAALRGHMARTCQCSPGDTSAPLCSPVYSQPVTWHLPAPSKRPQYAGTRGGGILP